MRSFSGVYLCQKTIFLRDSPDSMRRSLWPTLFLRFSEVRRYEIVLLLDGGVGTSEGVSQWSCLRLTLVQESS